MRPALLPCRGAGRPAGERSLGQWSHLALSSNGSDLKLYVDGDLVKTVAGLSPAATNADLTIGSSEFNTATSGTWNIFSQWHYLPEELPLLGCPAGTGGGAPVFNGRHYEANAHTNPGESETATPVEGDYIEVILNGGEQDVDCNSVEGTDKYVIASLEHGRWYDFIVHARWTHLEDNESSTFEVRTDADGNGTIEQVLGDQSTPISRTTLAWRLTPEMHNDSVYWQFGLYRGPSLEEPETTHYIDAVRSGNSYGEVVPGQ
jgi:Polysaccharide lyase